MIKSPKEKFQSSQIRTSQWAQIVANPVFDEACDAALLEMNASLPITPTFESASISYNQLVGANALVRILKTLHETTEQPKEPTQKGLNYQAGV